VHDVAEAPDRHEVGDGDGGGIAHPGEVVPGEVHEHQVFGAFLRIGPQLLRQRPVLLGGGAAGTRARDRVGARGPSLHADQGLRRGADDVDAAALAARVRQRDEVHVRARVGRPQDAVDLEGVRLAVHVHPEREHHLEHLAVPDRLLARPHGCLEVLRGPPEPEVGFGAVAEHGDDGWAGRRERTLHLVQAGDGILPGLVDPLIGAVPVDGVRDEPRAARVVVEGDEVGDEAQREERQATVVDRRVGQALPESGDVPPEHPYEPTREGRVAGKRGAGELGEGGAQHVEDRARGRQAGGDVAEPLRGAVVAEEGRPRADPDEAPPGPGPVFRRLEDEGAGVPSEGAVDAGRGELVREEPPRHRDHPVRAGQHAEAAEVWRRGAPGCRSHRPILARRPAMGELTGRAARHVPVRASPRRGRPARSGTPRRRAPRRRRRGRRPRSAPPSPLPRRR